MKKFLTLLIAAGCFIAVHAQNPRNEARRVILGRGNQGNYPVYSDGYPRNYPYINKKQRERRREINEYAYQRRMYGRRYRRYDNDDRYEERHDNGRHLGWQRGKGNRHHEHDDD